MPRNDGLPRHLPRRSDSEPHIVTAEGAHLLDALPAQISEKIWPEPNSGCWIWGAAQAPKGHALVRINNVLLRVHRIVWEAVNGPIPPDGPGYHGWCVCHRCDNPPCVNPDHLFLGSNRDNVDDMVRKNRQQRMSGERSSGAKLTWEKVRAVRWLRVSGVCTKEIAAQFGIARSTVYSIANGHTWVEDA